MNCRIMTNGLMNILLCALMLSCGIIFAQAPEQPKTAEKMESTEQDSNKKADTGKKQSTTKPGMNAFGLPQGNVGFGMQPMGAIPGGQIGFGMQPAGSVPGMQSGFGGMQPMGILFFQPGQQAQSGIPGQPGVGRPQSGANRPVHDQPGFWGDLWNGFWGNNPSNPPQPQPGTPGGAQPEMPQFVFGMPQNGAGNSGMTMYGYGIPFGIYGYGMGMQPGQPGGMPMMQFDRPAEQPKTSFMENLPESERKRLADLYKKDRESFRREIQKLLDTKHENKYQQVMELREKFFAEKDDSKKEDIKKQLKDLISQNYDVYQKSAERQIAETEYEIFMAQQRLSILKKAQSDRTQYAELLVKNTLEEYLDPEKIPSEDSVRKQFEPPWGAQTPGNQQRQGGRRGAVNGQRSPQGQNGQPGFGNGLQRGPQQGGASQRGPQGAGGNGQRTPQGQPPQNLPPQNPVSASK